jgi:malate dehydrogenase (oxaloacetate-decarboxylating)(NADP+)
MLEYATLDSERTLNIDDDIKATAAVVLARLGSALRITGGLLAEQRLLFLGAGKAAIGVADLVVDAMVAQGVARARARNACWLFDSRGLVVARRGDLAWRKRAYAHEHPLVLDFARAVHELKPTVIIGAAAAPHEFTCEVIEEMSRLHARPIIFVLSQPCSKAECSAQQAREWSACRALFASGSLLDQVEWHRSPCGNRA